MASSGFSFAARRAGMIAARIPMMIATIVSTISCTHGIAKRMSILRERRVDERGEEDPEREPERCADERRDDALLPDHATHLAARHPDRAQHADLARALVDREDERVDHPEDAHEDGEREHHVEERDELVEVRVLALDPLLASLELGVGEAGDGRFHLRAVLVGRLAGDVRPRPAVARTVVERVEQLGRDVHALDRAGRTRRRRQRRR